LFNLLKSAGCGLFVHSKAVVRINVLRQIAIWAFGRGNIYSGAGETGEPLLSGEREAETLAI